MCAGEWWKTDHDDHYNTVSLDFYDATHPSEPALPVRVPVSIADVNCAPHATGASLEAPMDGELVIDAGQYGTDPEGDPLVLVQDPAYVPPEHGTVEDVVGNVLVYRPDVGYVGSDLFSYVLEDVPPLGETPGTSRSAFAIEVKERTVDHIEVTPTIPQAVAPGGVVAFSGEAVYADGGRRDVTAAIQWSTDGTLSGGFDAPSGGVHGAVRRRAPRGELPPRRRFVG